jgi:hypothetical protein
MLKDVMNKLYWTFLGLLIIAGITVTIYFGLQPRPIPKIKPSEVATAERAGEAVTQRLWLELKDAKIVFLGVDPDKPDDMKVWKSFLDSFKNPDEKFTYVVIDPLLPSKDTVAHSDEIDMNHDFDRFVAGLKTAVANNQKVAVIVPTIYSSQAIPGNPINRMKEALLSIPFMSFSVVQPTLNREEEATAQFPCVTGSGDNSGLGSFGCLIQSKSRGLYMKKFESGKFLMLLDQIGATDYLLLLRQIP